MRNRVRYGRRSCDMLEHGRADVKYKSGIIDEYMRTHIMHMHYIYM